MKNHFGSLSLWSVGASLLLLTACNKSAQNSIVSETPAPQSTPAPVETPKVVASTPVPDELAPEGTYYLITKVSVETADGITGFPSGTKVQKSTDGKFQTSTGQALALTPNQFTNNLRIAREAAGAEASQRVALSQAAQQREASAAAAAAASVASAPAAAPASAPAAPPPVARPSSPLGSNALGSTHGLIRRGD
jgi:hypothetical protein